MVTNNELDKLTDKRIGELWIGVMRIDHATNRQIAFARAIEQELARRSTSESAQAGGSVIDIAARIFDFKPHKQTEEAKAKYLRFANEVIAQQAGAPVGWGSRRIDNGEYGSWLHSSRESAERHSANNGPAAPKYESVALYAAPAPAAEEVRQAMQQAYKDWCPYTGAPDPWIVWQAAWNAAMSASQGKNEEAK